MAGISMTARTALRSIGMEEYRNGGISEWRNIEVEEWQSGGVAESQW